MLCTLALVVLPSLILASPLSPRQNLNPTVICGQFDSLIEGPFTLFNDQFGSASATSGSQCAHLTSLNGNSVSWATNWTWVNGASGGGVKSFTNIQQDQGVGIQLNQISDMLTTWEWSYTLSSGAVADVAYDTFTANAADPNAANVNEIMVWLANFNAGPISATFDAQGQAVPVVSNLSLEGHTWNLFSGSNGANQVFSFLPTAGDITSFSGDLNAFFQFLVENEAVSSTQFLKTAQAGTEATSGTGVLTVSTYSLVINS